MVRLLPCCCGHACDRPWRRSAGRGLVVTLLDDLGVDDLRVLRVVVASMRPDSLALAA
jgi:hypothetical protein